MKVWNVKKGELEYSFKHKDSVNGLIELNNRNIASGSNDGVVRVWNLTDDGRLMSTFKAHENRAWSLAITQNGYLITGSWDFTIKVWDLN